MRPDSHEIYGRRRSRNVGVGLVLGAFVVLMFAVTVVKLSQGDALGHPESAPKSQLLQGTEASMGGRDPNTRLALRLGAVVVVMVSLSFAAVPFYSWFCRTTGYGGTPSVAEKAPEVALERTVTVRFDANTVGDMPWKFRPLQKQMKVRIGEMNLAFYEAYNPTDEVTAGQAAYNVAPDSAGRFFDKIACFCFNLQVLGPKERIEMPVSFFVDPKMVEDDDAGTLNAITLSYTMFRADVPAEDARASFAAPPAARVAAAPNVVSNQTLEQ